MRKKFDYLILHLYLFWESILWTLTDFARRGRMNHTKRMHERYKPPAFDADQSEAEINNNGQNNN